MKTTCRFSRIVALLVALGLSDWESVSAWAQVYCARTTSTNKTVWNAPFWWIDTGGIAYALSANKSVAAAETRLGSYYHTANLMSPGEGFGLVCSDGSAVGDGLSVVYQVDVTQPTPGMLATDIIFGVCSTNSAIGGLSGGSGNPTNTTAFQPSFSGDKWGFVCWLTNNPGVVHPEIEFHYVSGGNLSERHYADGVRFTLIACCSNLSPVSITRLAGGTMRYLGGSGSRFILLRSPSLAAALSTWQRAATNSLTPGTFTIPSLGGGGPAFYTIKSE